MADKYVGFDVHAATTSFCVRDSKGKVVAEGVVVTGASELVSLVKSIVGRIHLAFEEGTQAAWGTCQESCVCGNYSDSNLASNIAWNWSRAALTDAATRRHLPDSREVTAIPSLSFAVSSE